jgi:hypothetical protein
MSTRMDTSQPFTYRANGSLLYRLTSRYWTSNQSHHVPSNELHARIVKERDMFSLVHLASSDDSR